jgi:HK97 family phage major capsid protein
MAQINAKHDQVKTIFDEVDEKQKGEATKEQLAEVKKINKEIEELEEKASELQEGDTLRRDAEARREAARKAGDRLPLGNPADKGDGDDRSSEEFRRAKLASLGVQVINDADFKAWQAKLSGNGRVPDRSGIQSPTVSVKSLITGASDTSAGAGVRTEYYPTINAAPFKPLTLMDLVSKGETTSDLVEYARINSYTNNAAAVAEATAASGSSGTKPESAMDLVKVQEAVRTVAHWIPATNRALSDLAQLRTLIDTFLMFGLDEKLEDLMLNGDGTGENFLGILNTPGIQTQAFATDIITTTRKARTKCKTPGRVNPTAYLLNPLDWEAFDLSADNEQRYYFGGPSVLGNPRLWGLPVVENESITAGRGLTGDFRYALLWDRMQAAISVSNSHSDFFVRNLIAILAELRAAFGVLYTKAFVDIDLTP